MENKIADLEIKMINEVAGNFSRHPSQLNQLMEADAEIIDLKNKNIDYLVVKTDGLHEEISEKLYEDPFLIGWMSVTATLSDLAAVAAEPLGLLLSLQLTKNTNRKWLGAFKKGINTACSFYGVNVLGGDTNLDSVFSVSTTGIGTITDTRPLLRKPLLPGELLYATGKLGIGNAYAYFRFFNSSVNVNYQPVARLTESTFIKKYATACIDTSDGFFPALSVLSTINRVGIKITTPLQRLLDKTTLNVYQYSGLPAWMFLAGPHGEYELLFSIPPAMRNRFEQACTDWEWEPILIGEITEGDSVQFSSEEMEIQCSPSVIANLFTESNGDIQCYFENLTRQHKLWSQQ